MGEVIWVLSKCGKKCVLESKNTLFLRKLGGEQNVAGKKVLCKKIKLLVTRVYVVL